MIKTDDITQRSIERSEYEEALRSLVSIEYYEKDGYEDPCESGFMHEESSEFIGKHYGTLKEALTRVSELEEAVKDLAGFMGPIPSENLSVEEAKEYRRICKKHAATIEGIE